MEPQTANARASYAADAPNDMTMPERTAQDQADANNATFEHLRASFSQAERDVEALEQAVQAARVRRDVLGTALQALEQPKQPMVAGGVRG